MKTVYLHVGNLKTGSSAIQKYCSDHREQLLANQLDYPTVARPRGNNATNHGKLAISLLTKIGGVPPNWYRDRVDYGTVAGEVREAILGSRQANILISSEEFYRIARCDETARDTARGCLQALFRGFRVRVILYVRKPFDFAKSWYNEENKSNLPRRRFADFFYFLDDAYLLPSKNIAFWRSCFGEDCLRLEPYTRTGGEHIRRFFALLSLPDLTISPEADRLVHVKRDERSLELDRQAKIAVALRGEKKAIFLRNVTLSSKPKYKRLAWKIKRINRQFAALNEAEGLGLAGFEFGVGDVFVHEESVNRKDAGRVGLIRLCRFYLLHRYQNLRTWFRDVNH